MATSPTTREQRIKLISECRSSGLSDQQWCINHGINPGTFYNWVKRLRQEGCNSIPERTCASDYAPAPKQDVVEVSHDSFSEVSCINSTSFVSGKNDSVLNLSFGDINLKVSNDVNPELLVLAIRALRGAV